MCGIVGYIGKRNAYEVLVEGLHRLEYRGYDSAGVAIVKDDGEMNVYKSHGNHIAVDKGRDVDQPRNLAKSVTVE